MRKRIRLILIACLTVSTLVGCGKKEAPEQIEIGSVAGLIAKEGENVEPIVEEKENEIPENIDVESLVVNSLRDVTKVKYKTTVNITTKEARVSKFENNTIENEDSGLSDTSISANSTEQETSEKISANDIETTETSDTIVENEKDIVVDDTTEIKDTKVTETKVETEVATNIVETEDNETNVSDEELEINPLENEENLEVNPLDIEESESWLAKEDTNYCISVNYTTEMDTANAKQYGEYRIFLPDRDDTKEIAKYQNYNVEPSIEYVVKSVIETDEEENSKLVDKWYTQDTQFTGFRLFKDIVKNSEIVSYTENAKQYVITTNVAKDYIKALDMTNEIVDLLYAKESKIPVTYYIDKETELLSRIVFTVDENLNIFGDRVIDSCNYSIAFEKYNSINSVLIPDTITLNAEDISLYVEPTEEELNSLVEENKLVDDLIADKEEIEDEEKSTDKEETDTAIEDTKNKKDTEDTEYTTDNKVDTTKDTDSKEKKVKNK